MTTSARKPAAGPQTSSYDVAEHLRTPEEMAAYLDAWREDAPDDVAGVARAMGDVARAEGVSQGRKDSQPQA